MLEAVRSAKPDDMQCVFVRQPAALGLGHAILCAEGLIGDEHFAVLLADDLLVGAVPVTKQMVDVYREHGCSVLAVQEVSIEQTRQYGVVKGQAVSDSLLSIETIVEKPLPKDAPSNLAVTGRYILSPNIFACIRNQPRGAGGEIQLTDGIAGLLATEQALAYRYQGTRYDCGSKLGFLQANVVLGEAHQDAGEDFRGWLAEHLATRNRA
nr:UTP--glucose-1-phosphate uridylyltransferase [Noviherbaspirillum aridicola]